MMGSKLAREAAQKDVILSFFTGFCLKPVLNVTPKVFDLVIESTQVCVGWV
jgi:hypothetical protein